MLLSQKELAICIIVLVYTKAQSTFMPFRKALDNCFSRFGFASALLRSKTELCFYESGAFGKRSPEWSVLETEVQRISVDGRKGIEVFENAYVTAHWHALAGIAVTIRESVQPCVEQRK